MKQSFYIYSEGQLQRKDNTLRFQALGGKPRDLPIETVSDLYIMAEMTVNTALLNLVSKYGIALHFFNYYDHYIGSYYPKESLLAGQLLVHQVSCYQDENRRLQIAKKFVDGAAGNIYRNLRYYNNRGKNLEEAMEDVMRLREQAEMATSISELMGFEGLIHKRYYESFAKIVNQSLEFEKRVKNPPDNEINTLISFVNSLIYTTVLSEIYKTQLNPTISYLHEPGVRRFSLSLDIAEIFKPLLGDRLIFSMLNRGQITKKDFTEGLNGMHLTKEGSRKVAQAMNERLSKTIRHKALQKDVSYRYLIRLECYKLIKDLIDEKPYEPFVIWW